MKTPKVVLELNPTASNPRNSEGSIIELEDGRLMFAYSHFYGGAADDAPAFIAARFSADRGQSWDREDTILVQNEVQNVMSVSFLRLNTREIGLFYLLRYSLQDLRMVISKSRDEGKTWSEPRLCMAEPGYYVVNNDRIIQLVDGRILIPAALHPCTDGTWETWQPKARASCVFSDDGGATWSCSKALEAPKESGSGLQEPGIIQLPDGTVMLWARTDLGSQYIAFSKDGGCTWSQSEPSDLLSPLSPASIKRIPSTGEYLCLYNDHSGRFSFVPGKRTPLVAARSRDGITWYGHKLVEGDPDGWYCYTSISFVDDNVFLGYCAGDSQVGGLNRLRLTRVPLSWLLEGGGHD